MKKFSFPLQKLLSLREFKEKEAEIELGRAISFFTKKKLELESIVKDRIQQNLTRKQSSSIQDLLIVEHYIARLDAKKEIVLDELAKAEIAVDEARQRYLITTKERKIISKLKEKKHTSWKKEILTEEADILDDLSNFDSSIKQDKIL